jgi:hypothetical protein
LVLSAQQTRMHKRKNNMQGLVLDGWMNGDEDKGSFHCFRVGNRPQREKHPKLCLLACLFLFIEPWMTCLCW